MIFLIYYIAKPIEVQPASYDNRDSRSLIDSSQDESILPIIAHRQEEILENLLKAQHEQDQKEIIKTSVQMNFNEFVNLVMVHQTTESNETRTEGRTDWSDSKLSFINNDIGIAKNFLLDSCKQFISKDAPRSSDVRVSIDRQMTGKIYPDPDSSFRKLESTPRD